MKYFDNNATTKPFRVVLEAVAYYSGESYYNASSATTIYTDVRRPVESAASAMAKLLGAEEPEAVIFTSGATEANNWVFLSASRTFQKGRVVVGAGEHYSITEPAERMKSAGFDVAQVGLDRDGVISLNDLQECLDENTVLVSIMMANNETGVVQPIRKIGELVRKKCPRALFHTDATQAVGKIEINLVGDYNEVDLLSFSGHKFHGPKGVGGLYVRPGTPLVPLLIGGGQQQGMRSGTENVPGLAGISAAAEILCEGLTENSISTLRDNFERELQFRFPGVIVHSAGQRRIPNTSCFSIPGIVGEEVAERLALEGVIVGTGSACSSGGLHPPRTLLAMKVDYPQAVAAIRVSLSRESSESDVAHLIEKLGEVVKP